ncbi:MAG: Proline iminopeptidase [Lentisphaerae bacterium ADurb.Bin242]|nr:MAG: Proline iminopeptidase [Lentisphaerae bacterium ADurb.Bin242]
MRKKTGRITKDHGHVQEGRIQVRGGKIRYKMTGKDKPGIPLLTVHGGPGASHDYLAPLEALADERPVIFYDQLDCGNSDKPGRPELWTLERYAEELHQVRRALEIDKMYILGQSWGTALALEYALEHRENTAGLVLSGPLLSTARWEADQRAWIAGLPPAHRTAIREAEISGNFESPSYRDAMMEYYRRHVCRLERWPDCLNRSLSKLNFRLYQYMWGPSEFTVAGTLKNYDRVGRLKEITVPVLFTCGTYDEAAPETVGNYRKQIHGAELHVFEEASHEHHLEKPDEYISVVREFLARADRAGQSC